MAPLVLALSLFAGVQEREPEVGRGPAPAPNPIAWEIELEFLDPQRIVVRQAEDAAAVVYWYIVYTATNTSATTQRFHPTFQLVTEGLRVIDTDMGIGPLVFDHIKERHRITHPDLVDPNRAIGDLLTGDDNARESVAIWRNVDLGVNKFAVYVAGLSGETRIIRNPAFDPSRPDDGTAAGPRPPKNPKYFTLRKTLEIEYGLPGSPRARERAQPTRKRVRWIMR